MSLARWVLLGLCLGSLSRSSSFVAASFSPPASGSRIFSSRSPHPWSRSHSRFSLFSPSQRLAQPRSNYTHLPALQSLDHPLPSDEGTLCSTNSQDCKSTTFTPPHAAGTAGLILWLLVLFYLLGTTASDYFSCTLEKLSEVWGLSPAVAGVTLLAIGNGAPDVFSSVAAFLSSDKAGSIGFSCVLGGALFITTVVSGTVALVTATRSAHTGFVRIDLFCFVRDVVFLLVSSGALALILRDGKVYLWEAIGFLSLYVVYTIAVWVQEVLHKLFKSHFSLQSPLLDPPFLKAELETLPQWSYLPQQSPHQLHLLICKELVTEDPSVASKCKHYAVLFYKYAIEWPFALPRRLTIPIIEEARWSRPLAVLSCALAPAFVLGVLMLQLSNFSHLFAAGISIGLGIILGLLAFFTTENTRPPQRFIWVWLSGGFLMSIVWFYLIADQLVESLQSLGAIFQVSPAILGLTVMAWGNCVGDLVADLALACSGREGVQIAVSGCYSGPLFNMVVGLGLSLVIACWRSQPFLIVDDGSLFCMIGFLVAGLAWALLMMPLRGMRLSRSLGVGLILVYGSFLVAGMCYEMGWFSAP